MDINYEAQYHRLEEQHWWFQGRREFVFSLIQGLKLPTNAPLLEIGCSGGPLLLRLRDTGYTNTTGIDISSRAIELARKRGLSNTHLMDGARLDFPDENFDIIIASDVLEHIEDEAQALQEWRRVLRPGGYLLVFVPAFASLWSQHDVVNHHFRRYTSASLVAAMQHADFLIDRTSYWNGILFPPALLVRSMQRLLRPVDQSPLPESTGDLTAVPTPINTSLLTLLRLENRLLKWIDLPVGVSVFAVAHKPALSKKR